MITLCIPTHNRSHYLGRILRYYKGLNFSVPIMIADSSSEPYRTINKKLIAEAAGTLHIQYKEYDTSISILGKIIEALKKIDSEFACLCADDDFIVPESLSSCVSFLKLNPDYSIAHGKVVMSVFQPQEGEGKAEGIHTYAYAQLETQDAADIPRRLRGYFKNSGSSFYSVYRRDNLINNLETVTLNTKGTHFAELLLDALNLVQGKVKSLDMLFMVRQFTPERESAKVISWSDLIHSKEFNIEYGAYFKCLSAELTRRGIEGPASEEIINSGFKDYTREIRKSLWQTRPARLIHAAHCLMKVLFNPPYCGKVAQIRNFLANPGKVMSESRYESDKMSVRTLTGANSPYQAAFLNIYPYLVQYPRGVQLD